MNYEKIKYLFDTCYSSIGVIYWKKTKGRLIPIIELLISHFISYKNRKPTHADELLDYIQEQYISGKLSAANYKHLYSELDKRGAKKAKFIN